MRARYFSQHEETLERTTRHSLSMSRSVPRRHCFSLNSLQWPLTGRDQFLGASKASLDLPLGALGVLSRSSPVAIRTTVTALPITSADRF